MTDWLLPLRKGESNEEARYALRTWVRHAGMVEGLDRLVTVGHCPAWLTPDLHIPGNRGRSGPVNIYANIRDACSTGLLTETAIIGNDDFYAMEPIDPLRVYYRSSLREHIGKLPQQATWWASSLRLTYNLLRAKDIPDPRSYELHRPLPVVVEDMARVLTDSWSGSGIPVQFRSAYGNLCRIGGEQSHDGKIVSRATYPPSVPVWSTTDASWRWAGETIRERFTEPTIWEA